MNKEYLFLLLLAIFLILVVFYLLYRLAFVPKRDYLRLNTELCQTKFALENLKQISEKQHHELSEEKKFSLQKSDELSDTKAFLAKATADLEYHNQQLATAQTEISKLLTSTQELADEKLDLMTKNTELFEQNKNLTEIYQVQKKDFLALQETTKLQFENLANKILEDKSQKFTALNHENLENILKPFQEKITELKNRVNEAYETENKERFSLAERVKELAALNQKISEDAKKLTQALKGESKTQGNWGEMILENILEKSGLIKNQEYFTEYQLQDNSNNPLLSDFSGKKMRPDVVIKYPGDRFVIIDAKVSLTAFAELTNDQEAENQEFYLKRHLTSVKNHIIQLSQKAYDDFEKSMDFVMMFIPSESAYIAAMQAETNLWNFAYEKRILLLNPSNLITSLKLIEDLWKREHQNQNALQIASRGAKLYDKLVSFVENLEKVGKNMNAAKTAYDEAYRQLYTGKGNVVNQAFAMKNLGLKNKKDFNAGLIEDSEHNQSDI